MKAIFAMFFISLTGFAQAQTEVEKANIVFSTKLYASLAKTEGNICFSPISIHTVLSMIQQGAKDTTVEALTKSLGVSPNQTSADYQSIISDLNAVKDVELSMANKVFVKEGLKINEDFNKTLTNNFKSEVQAVNFWDNSNATKTINDWVEQKTNRKIENLLQEGNLNDLTRLVLVNAIYFKGDWQIQFNKLFTENDTFHVNDNTTKSVKMMKTLATRVFYQENTELEAQVLKLLYKNNDFSMIFILPEDMDGIKKLESKLENYDLSKIVENVTTPKVDVIIPKFKISQTIDLEGPLKDLGLDVIFSESANFKGIIENEDLSVNKAVQKSFIEVNEEGSEAAAATGMVISLRMAIADDEPPTFRANHPFIFLIVKNNDVLFMGRISDP